MAYKEYDNEQTNFTFEKLKDNIPMNHSCRLIKDIIEENFSYIDDENIIEVGQPAFRKSHLLGLLVFASYDGIYNLKKISEYCKFHDCYKFMVNGLQPSEYTLQRFIHDFGYLFNDLNKCLIQLATDKGFTDFNKVIINGYLEKSNNSNDYIIRKDDINTLLKNIPKTLNYNELEKLLDNMTYTAFIILINNNMTNEEKIDYVKFLESELQESELNSIKINDNDARWIINSKKPLEIVYDLKASVDYETKIIENFDFVQYSKDQNQLSNQVNQIGNTTNKTFDNINTDIGFYSNENYYKLKHEKLDEDVSFNQTKQFTSKLNSNSYQKDHFEYDSKTDSYICSQNMELPCQDSYIEKSENPDKPDKINKVYYNLECQNCIFEKECTKSLTRVITDYSKFIQEESNTQQSQSKTPKQNINENKPTNNLNNIIYDIDWKISGFNFNMYLKMIKNEPENNNNLKIFLNKIKREYPNINLEVIIN